MEYDKKWYNSLKKSSLNPPSWVFGVVWPILYIMIISSFVVFIRATKTPTFRNKAILLFITQFILNISWSPLFFTYKKICFSLVIILFLVLFVYLTIIEFYKTSPVSAYLLVPYFIWISFATYLNFFVCVNNK